MRGMRRGSGGLAWALLVAAIGLGTGCSTTTLVALVKKSRDEKAALQGKVDAAKAELTSVQTKIDEAKEKARTAKVTAELAQVAAITSAGKIAAIASAQTARDNAQAEREEAQEKKAVAEGALEGALKEHESYASTEAAIYEEVRLRYVYQGGWVDGLIADPGWFDVGLGFGTIANSEPDREEVLGLMIHLKAYPFGKWWASVPKEEGSDELVTITDYSVLQLFRRISCVVGVSTGDLRGGDVEGAVFFAGISYDIAPQFSIVAGAAFYEFEETITTGNTTRTDKEVDVGLYVGVSINVDAMLGLLNYEVGSTRKASAVMADSDEGGS